MLEAVYQASRSLPHEQQLALAPQLSALLEGRLEADQVYRVLAELSLEDRELEPMLVHFGALRA